MKIYEKVKTDNGSRDIYFLGKKIFSYNNREMHPDYRKSKIYDRIYHPIYSLDNPITNAKPEIYNSHGKKMDIFFLRDRHCAQFPYMNRSQYFLWDRFNIGLDTHFYSHNTILETMGKPRRKFALFMESPAIVPRDYEIFTKNAGLEKEFDAIFTMDERMLDSLPNAKFFIQCANIWIGTEGGGGDLIPNRYSMKIKDISILSSAKQMCDLHKARIACAERCKRLNLADTFGTFDGGGFVKTNDTLEQYRYSIIFENDIRDFWFTEKITNCFATQTIPIYLGARKIDQFFNPDGIITITPDDALNIEKVLKQCTPEEYERRLPAIIDNYNRVQEYRNMDDWLYEHYFLEQTK